MREKNRTNRNQKKPMLIYPTWKKLKRLFNKKVRKNKNLESGAMYKKSNYTNRNLS